MEVQNYEGGEWSHLSGNLIDFMTGNLVALPTVTLGFCVLFT